MCSTMRSQDLIESPEAARILGITVDQLRRRVKNGKVIPIIKKRNILLFSRKELSDSISEKNSWIRFHSPGICKTAGTAQVYSLGMDQRSQEDSEASCQKLRIAAWYSGQGSLGLEQDLWRECFSSRAHGARKKIGTPPVCEGDQVGHWWCCIKVSGSRRYD